MQRASTINRLAVDTAALRPAAAASAASTTRHAWRRRIAKVSRWLHVYGSMASLSLVLFFALTGITLNHQDWFAGQQVTTDRHGSMTIAWLNTGVGEGVDKLQVAEFLRSTAGLAGAVSDFRIDGRLCEVVFKGPGYEASALVDRTSGRFDVTETRMGLAALVNDLHKGRDTGPVWRAVLDVSAALLVFISLTGLILLYFVHRYRLAGMILIGAGALASYLAVLLWVP